MKQSLEQLFTEFVREKRFSKKLSSETIRGYESGFKLFRTLLPTVQLETVNKNNLLVFFEKLETRERVVGRGILKKGVTKSTIATYWSKLNAFFDWLKRHKHIAENPFDEMEYPSVRYEDKKFLVSEDIGKIFTALTIGITWSNTFIQKRNIAIFTVLLCCGLRKAELLGLGIRDIDFERRLMKIDGATSKSKRDRVVPINTDTYNALISYFAERSKFKSYSDCLFLSDNGQDGLKHSGFKHLLDKVRNASGVNFHAHQFRHTFAVNLLNKNVDIAKLKQLLGHRDIRMTAAYVRCLPSDMLRGDMELIRVDNLL